MSENIDVIWPDDRGPVFIRAERPYPGRIRLPIPKAREDEWPWDEEAGRYVPPEEWPEEELPQAA